jgi:hypothetical protein
MKFPMTGQEKCDLSIQVTTWTNLTIYKYILPCKNNYIFSDIIQVLEL